MYYPTSHFNQPQNPFWLAGLITILTVIWISPKNSTCLSVKLSTQITSLIAKSTSPGKPDTNFFARCWLLIRFDQGKSNLENKETGWSIPYNNHLQGFSVCTSLCSKRKELQTIPYTNACGVYQPAKQSTLIYRRVCFARQGWSKQEKDDLV